MDPVIESFLQWLMLVVIGMVGVWALVAYAMRGVPVRVRALPRGTRPVTQAELDEAHERMWKNDQAVEALRKAGVL